MTVNTPRAMLEAMTIKADVMARMKHGTSFFEAARLVLAKRLYGKRGQADWILDWEVKAFLLKEPQRLEQIFELEQKLISGEVETPFFVRPE
nr:hypothetical protein [Pseudomonas corrugata]